MFATTCVVKLLLLLLLLLSFLFLILLLLRIDAFMRKRMFSYAKHWHRIKITIKKYMHKPTRHKWCYANGHDSTTWVYSANEEVLSWAIVARALRLWIVLIWCGVAGEGDVIRLMFSWSRCGTVILCRPRNVRALRCSKHSAMARIVVREKVKWGCKKTSKLKQS